MGKPNLFDIATSELSQDGFFTWLLRWAHPANLKENAELCRCGQDFIKLLLNAQGKTVTEITEVKVWRQWQDIDIWASINEHFAIVLEDKTNTGAAAGQLERYRETARAWCAKTEGYDPEPVCVYVKTGSESKRSLAGIRAKGFAVITRQDLLGVLENCGTKNAIFQEFVSHLQALEDAEAAYATKPVDKWDWRQWVGFYQSLDKDLAGDSKADWRYVSNPAGGFWGFWWHFMPWKNHQVYLQIEQGRLCFKIEVFSEDKAALRNEWQSVILDKAKAQGKTEIVKPKRAGTGEWMTVAVVDRAQWLGADGSKLDTDAVLARLKGYEQFLDS
ncbi:MAG: PD-(D/E)XK nuclease family protein [Treponema sp.]|jgi:hypothetical protein|nr:PD-(D/E)XK nuclease family protein [Treponema sp.]